MGWCLMALILEKRQRGSSSNRKGQASQIRRAVTTARLEFVLAGLKFIRREKRARKLGERKKITAGASYKPPPESLPFNLASVTVNS
jgi:hypothetical protein